VAAGHRRAVGQRDDLAAVFGHQRQLFAGGEEAALFVVDAHLVDLDLGALVDEQQLDLHRRVDRDLPRVDEARLDRELALDGPDRDV
jgi:hypothetical protein